jgi:ubiquinone/menaquinone biosynthesis C-methylase UbiE
MTQIIDSPIYSSFAKVYDEAMRNVDYTFWAEYIEMIAQIYMKPHQKILASKAPKSSNVFARELNPKVQKLIDLSCGTATLLKNLHSKFSGFGSDLSLEMLKLAQKKVTASLCCAKLTQLPFKKEQFSVALALYDTVNYLQTEKELIQFLDDVHKILYRNGLLIFDVVTPFACKEIYDGYSESFFIDGRDYVKRAWFTESTNIQYNEVRIVENGKQYVELHKQKIYTLREVEKNLQKASFHVLAILDNYTFNEGTETSERVHFVCGKR